MSHEHLSSLKRTESYRYFFIYLILIIMLVTPTIAQEQATYTTTTTGSVNVRVEASSSGSLVAVLEAGQEVTVIAVIETDSTQYPIWYEIALDDDATGFAWSGLFSELEPIPLPESTSEADAEVADDLGGMLDADMPVVATEGYISASNMQFRETGEQNTFIHDEQVVTKSGEVIFDIYTQDVETLNAGRNFPIFEIEWSIPPEGAKQAMDLLWSETYAALIKNFPEATTPDGLTYNEALGFEVGSTPIADEVLEAMNAIKATGAELPLMTTHDGKYVNPNLPPIIAPLPMDLALKAMNGDRFSWVTARTGSSGDSRFVSGLIITQEGQAVSLLAKDSNTIKYYDYDFAASVTQFSRFYANLYNLVGSGQKLSENLNAPEFEVEFLRLLGVDVVNYSDGPVEYMSHS